MKQYVISDIHGCADTFDALLNKIGLNKDDHLYLLGDYIDRGRSSSSVLETILNLKEEQYNLFPIRGNHEEHILKAEKEYDTPTFAYFVKKVNKSKDLLDEKGSLISKYRDFFEKLPYFYMTTDFIIVHAGLNVSLPDPFSDTNAMIDLRGFLDTKDHSALGKRKIIHGHVPTELDEIINKIELKSQIIPLDNGCVYTKPHKIYDHTKLGNLLCLNLDNFDLTIQKNID